MSGYGHDQVYVNAACLERYRARAKAKKARRRRRRRDGFDILRGGRGGESSSSSSSDDEPPYQTVARHFLGGAESSSSSEDEDEERTPIDYRAIAMQHKRRLEREGATKRSIGFLLHLFRVASDNPNSNPIDFLL